MFTPDICRYCSAVLLLLELPQCWGVGEYSVVGDHWREKIRDKGSCYQGEGKSKKWKTKLISIVSQPIKVVLLLLLLSLF